MQIVTLSYHGLIEANATLHMLQEDQHKCCQFTLCFTMTPIYVFSSRSVSSLYYLFVIKTKTRASVKETICDSYVSSTLQTNMTNTNQMHTFYDLSIFIRFFSNKPT